MAASSVFIRSLLTHRFCGNICLHDSYLIRNFLPTYVANILIPCKRYHFTFHPSHLTIYSCYLRRLFSKHSKILKLRNPITIRTTSSGHYSTANIDLPDHTHVTSPYELVEEHLSALTSDIREVLHSAKPELQKIAHYYVDGKGKAFRPMIIMLMAKACNCHNTQADTLTDAQYKIAMIAEMIHTASLVHDDVIDRAHTRRAKQSINKVWGHQKVILAGDFILAKATIVLALLRNDEVVVILSQVIEDLVRGEFMQLGSKEDEDERFAHYLKKTFKKTASLIANSCKAVAVLTNCSEVVTEIAYQYGRNLGIAFQLIDDLLDVIQTEAIMGKPTATDLKLGLATAPVLFAAQQYPELHPLIMRRFSEEGDVDLAWDLVKKSDGVGQTRILAERHGQEAIKLMQQLEPSPAQEALIRVVKLVINRRK